MARYSRSLLRNSQLSFFSHLYSFRTSLPFKWIAIYLYSIVLSCTKLFSTIFQRSNSWPSTIRSNSTATLLIHSLIFSHPPKSICLQKRIHRWKQSQFIDNILAKQQLPPVFVIPYSPLSRLIPTRTLLCKYWELIQDASNYSIPKPIIAYQSCPSLVKTLVYQRSRHMDKIQIESLCTNSSQNSNIA